MRMIASLHDQKQANNFSLYLRNQGIANTCEVHFDPSIEQIVCKIWVHDEDELPKANTLYEEFQRDPNDPKYQLYTLQSESTLSAIKNPNYGKKTQKKESSLGLVAFILLLCVGIFLGNLFQQNQKEEGQIRYPLITPVQKWLLFDIPPALIALDRAFFAYDITPSTRLEDLSPEAKKALTTAKSLPYFQGFYNYALASIQQKPIPSGPLFVALRKGQVWRLFTPAILHRDLLHILFNMLWLWLLGKQMEKRLSTLQLLIFILITGSIANTCQYLMSGPMFLGFSGVIMAMAGFIWMRQRIAPWEGYPIAKSTFVFLTFFVFAMVALQLASFFLEISGRSFLFNIANTAHIAGGVAGALLGRSNFFAWRIS
ncbi:MAG: rhomboid family intramembrane serine protease [Chlamydiota bacterium]